jgi:hypothetical protein
MATINLNDLRIKNAKNLIDSFNSPSNDALAYMFIGRPVAWPTGDNSPPNPTNNFKEFYNTYDQMLSLKRINDNDAYHMITRNRWVGGVTYDIYRDDYSSQNKSFTGQSNLYDANYYVINSSNYIYVCLDNNGNSPSITEPQDLNDDPFYTSDGYQWLKMYSLSATDLTDRATEDFIPIMTLSTNNVTVGADGAVYTVLIDSAGTGYTANPAGGQNALPYYYAHIRGDGSGAVARVKVGLERIQEVEVVRNGGGYTEATLDFTANNVYASLVDLDAGISALNPGGNGDFRSTVIIGPPGGWGSDLTRQLGGTKVGIFSSLLSSDFDFVEDVTFRQIGIIQDPTFPVTTQENAATLSASYAIAVENVAGSGFTIGETISQSVEVDGIIKTAKGQIVSYNTGNQVVKYIQDPNLHRDLDDQNLYDFAELASQSQTIVNIVGETSGTSANPDSLRNGSYIDLYFASGYADPEVTKYSGYMTYLTNQPPITRQNNQSEKISLIVGY